MRKGHCMHFLKFHEFTVFLIMSCMQTWFISWCKEDKFISGLLNHWHHSHVNKVNNSKCWQSSVVNVGSQYVSCCHDSGILSKLYKLIILLSLPLFFSLSVFLCFFVWSLLWGLLLASSMAESPVASGIAAETQFAGWCLSPAFTHCRELMKSVGKLW